MKNIRRVFLRHGASARHPVFQIIFAGGLVLIGMIGLVFLSAGRFGAMRLGGGMAMFGVLGVWLFYDALRIGHYLVVETMRGKERCEFDKQATKEGIQAFLEEAQSRFGLPVEFLARPHQ